MRTQQRDLGDDDANTWIIGCDDNRQASGEAGSPNTEASGRIHFVQVGGMCNDIPPVGHLLIWIDLKTWRTVRNSETSMIENNRGETRSCEGSRVVINMLDGSTEPVCEHDGGGGERCIPMYVSAKDCAVLGGEFDWSFHLFPFVL
jgi:hypothetical protein